MSEPCSHCGASQLVTVRLPGHDEVEAILCMACGAPQQQEHPAARPQQ